VTRRERSGSQRLETDPRASSLRATTSAGARGRSSSATIRFRSARAPWACTGAADRSWSSARTGATRSGTFAARARRARSSCALACGPTARANAPIDCRCSTAGAALASSSRSGAPAHKTVTRRAGWISMRCEGRAAIQRRRRAHRRLRLPLPSRAGGRRGRAARTTRGPSCRALPQGCPLRLLPLEHSPRQSPTARTRRDTAAR
jgi:hypothetical protein